MMKHTSANAQSFMKTLMFAAYQTLDRPIRVLACVQNDNQHVFQLVGPHQPQKTSCFHFDCPCGSSLLLPAS